MYAGNQFHHQLKFDKHLKILNKLFHLDFSFSE
jgi:hypothetical protein